MDPDFSDEEDRYERICHQPSKSNVINPDEVIDLTPLRKKDDTGIEEPRSSTNGTLKLDDGVYTGEILDGRANGRGVLMKWDGHRYEGEFINDMPDGKGILLRLHGSNSTEKIYEGRFLENKFDGQGTFYWSDGSRYQGTWKN
ncbi:unnamed protein product, partial [Adineta steineri]